MIYAHKNQLTKDNRGARKKFPIPNCLATMPAAELEIITTIAAESVAPYLFELHHILLDQS